MLKHTDKQALTQVNSLLPATLLDFTDKKDKNMESHVWANQTPQQDTGALVGLCMQRLAGGRFSLLSLFTEEL